MTGGLDGSWTTLSSTVFVYGNGTIETGPQLPEARSGHCMVTLHDGKVLILGANPNSPSLYKNVIIFDPAQNTFTTGPSLSYNRDNAACTLFNSNLHDNRPVVLAAGGWGQATAEVYDYTNDNAWQTSIHFIISRFQSELTSFLFCFFFHSQLKLKLKNGGFLQRQTLIVVIFIYYIKNFVKESW